jgi:hypothetical protein
MNNRVAIKSLSLFNGGLLGGKLKYAISEGSDIIYKNVIDKVNYCALPDELITEVNKLKVHGLRITEMWTKTADKYYDFNNHELMDIGPEDTMDRLHEKLSRCRISGIRFAQDGFALTFEYRRFDGNVFMKMFTELVTAESGYQYFDSVMEVIDAIAPIAYDWSQLKGGSNLNDIKFSTWVSQNNYDDPKKAREAFEKLSDDEKESISIEYLTKGGNIVISPQEALEDDFDQEEQAPEIEETPRKEPKGKVIDIPEME